MLLKKIIEYVIILIDKYTATNKIHLEWRAMPMIRIAAVDDDSIFLQELKDIISLQIDNHQYPYKLDLYNDSEIFLECLLKTPYDLVFLDMDMPKYDGISIAKKLSAQNIDTTVIIVTEHEHYARVGYRYHVFRFVRKGYLAEEIQEPIKSFLSEKVNVKHNIILNTDNGMVKNIEPSKIVYLVSVGHYISLKEYGSADNINLISGKYTMNQFESQLEPYGFLRIHKSYLVNFRYVVKIQYDKMTISESAGIYKALPISHKKSSDIRKKVDLLFRKEDRL